MAKRKTAPKEIKLVGTRAHGWLNIKLVDGVGAVRCSREINSAETVPLELDPSKPITITITQ